MELVGIGVWIFGVDDEPHECYDFLDFFSSFGLAFFGFISFFFFFFSGIHFYVSSARRRAVLVVSSALLFPLCVFL